MNLQEQIKAVEIKIAKLEAMGNDVNEESLTHWKNVLAKLVRTNN